MASKSALVVIASVLSATLVYAQQPAPATPAAPAAPQAPVTLVPPQSAPDTPFKLPLIPPAQYQRPFVIEVDDLPVAPAVRPSPQSTPAPCTTHKMPMAFANPNFDSKMVIKGPAPKPPCT